MISSSDLFDQSTIAALLDRAVQIADRFHICKNLTEATQLLLARCQAEIVVVSQTQEPRQVKQAEVKVPTNLHRLQKFSANTAVWLFVRDPKTLDEIEREDLAAFCQASATLKRAYQLIQDFLSMVRKREGHRLDAWLGQVAESCLPELQHFAAGVEKDKAAVRAGLTYSINNGMVEGHVTKLKLIKRTMYGRAEFPLLRQRVLHAV